MSDDEAKVQRASARTQAWILWFSVQIPSLLPATGQTAPEAIYLWAMRLGSDPAGPDAKDTWMFNILLLGEGYGEIQLSLET